MYMLPMFPPPTPDICADSYMHIRTYILCLYAYILN